MEVNFDLFLEKALFSKANLENAILVNANITNVSFNKCRMFGVNLHGAIGIETVQTDWIDIGKKGSPERLIGKDALNWLVERTYSS